MLIEKGVYRDVDLTAAAPDQDLEPDQDLVIYQDDKVRLTKYYGLVPRKKFNEAMDLPEPKEESKKKEGSKEHELDEPSEYVEAIVVVANGGQLLKVGRKPLHDARSSSHCLPLGCCSRTFLGTWYL